MRVSSILMALSAVPMMFAAPPFYRRKGTDLASFVFKSVDSFHDLGDLVLKQVSQANDAYGLYQVFDRCDVLPAEFKNPHVSVRNVKISADQLLVPNCYNALASHSFNFKEVHVSLNGVYSYDEYMLLIDAINRFVTHLQFAPKNQGPAFMRAIAGSESLAHLSLDLSNEGVQDASFDEVQIATFLNSFKGVKGLSISNDLESVFIDALSHHANGFVSQLESLSFIDNSIGMTAELMNLLNSLDLQKFKRFNVVDLDTEDISLLELGSSLITAPGNKIEELNLGYVHAPYEEIKMLSDALANNVTWSLRELNFMNVLPMSMDEIKAFTEALNDREVYRLQANPDAPLFTARILFELADERADSIDDESEDDDMVEDDQEKQLFTVSRANHGNFTIVEIKETSEFMESLLDVEMDSE